MNFKIAAVTFSVIIIAMIITLTLSQPSSTTIRTNYMSSTNMPSNGGTNNSNNNNTNGSGSLTTKGAAISATTQQISTTTKGVGTVLASTNIIFISFFITNICIVFIFF